MKPSAQSPIHIRNQNGCNRLASLAITVTFAWFLGSTVHTASPQPPASSPSNILIVIGEDEYLTWETLPRFAETDLHRPDYMVRIIHQDPADIHSFPNLVQSLSQADLLILSIRRRALPKDQLNAIRTYLDLGKPLVAIRTSSHAFSPRGADRALLTTDPPRDEWPEFDPVVLGGNYSGHFGAGPTTTIQTIPETADHPILAHLDLLDWKSVASLYRTSPLAPSATPLLLGEIPDNRIEPLAWTHRHGPRQAPVFYTSLGHPEDFQNPVFRKLLLNAIAWALNPAPANP